jgi:hypothetical protein
VAPHSNGGRSIVKTEANPNSVAQERTHDDRGDGILRTHQNRWRTVRRWSSRHASRRTARAPIASSGTEGLSGAKVITAAPLPELLRMSAVMTLADYVWAVAVDTNTKELWGERVSVTSIAKLWAIRGETETLVLSEICTTHEFRNVSVKPELHGWKIASESIVATPDYKAGGRFALVVDSELGKLPTFNARLEPIVERFFLPERLTLMYASTDLQRDSFINRVLKQCDRAAGKVLERIAASSSQENLVAVDGQLFTHGRKW